MLYASHWSLLVDAIGILCSNSISHEDLTLADSMFQDFVILMGILYGATLCTMNIHLLQHLAYNTCHKEDCCGLTAALLLKV